MIILGLNHGEINSSAALIKDGKVLAAAPEERFSRNKRTKLFPKKATEYCLESNNITLSDCSFIAQGWNPGEYWQKYNPLLSQTRIKREDYLYTVPDNLYDFTDRNSSNWILQTFSDDTNMPPIYFIKHHLAHAANGFFLSPFKEAAILTCDWRGELDSTLLGFGNDNNIQVLATQKIPHSLGMFYGTYTSLLGYRPDSDEWKVMALSAFDVDYSDYLEKIRSTISLTEDGLFELDQSYYQGAILDKPKLYTDKLLSLLGNREGVPGEEPENWHFCVAKAMQTVAEEIVFHILDNLYKTTKCENLVLSGGFFMNSVCNGKILKNSKFKNLYISYAPADVGNSIGAALYVSHCIQNEKRDLSFNSSYIGPSFTCDEVEKALTRRKIKFKKLNNPSVKIASLLNEGKIVANFNGRMEFGERALGNRSILADPRKKETRDKINSIIKYRERYRPFAPSVLYEKAHLFFDVSKNFECNNMEIVIPVREEYRDDLAAITHVDGSGRLHTVKKEHNEQFYRIIEEFEKLSNFPVIINTSFNINGDPIVLSPDDALNTFYNSGLEYLVLENFLVQKHI